jgi:long-subunit acyl-CoA synthetase (AMP-forming)
VAASSLQWPEGSRILRVTERTPRLGDRLANVGVVRVSDGEALGSVDVRLRASAIAQDLLRMGIGAGDRLAVGLPNGPEFVAVFLACVQLEITFVPINPALPSDEADRRCRAVGVAGFLNSREGMRQVSGERPSRPQSRPTAAVVFFTSGSEGSARAVAISEHALLHVADTHHRALGYARGDAIVGFLPWSHAFGFTLELLMALLYEGALRTVAPAAFPEALPGDFLFAVPRMIERLSDTALHRIRGGIVGGAPVRGQVRRRLEGTRLRVGYGQTECAPGALLGDAGEWGCDDFLGRPVGCEVILRPGAADDVGELMVRGPNLAVGYVQSNQLIPVTGADGWRETGDLATGLDDGFVFQGRKDELFKLDNGRMVNPVPLEVPYDGQILLIGAGRSAVQPLARGETPSGFSIPVPHVKPKLMPEAFWAACTTVTGKISRRRAQDLFYQP